MTDQPAATGAFAPPNAGDATAASAPFSRRATAVATTLIFGVALALRLIPLVVYPSIAVPDELFQSLEPAHRLVFGYGLMPWEFKFGTRSWLLPGALAGLMWLGARIGDVPVYYLAVVHLALSALAASVCLCAYRWGERAYGTWGGVIAASLPALWPDNVFYGGRTLSETVAAPLLVFAVYLAAPGYRVTARRRLAAAGALLAFAVAIRLQLAPAAAAIALCLAWHEPRHRLPPIALGAGVILALSGGLDAATWGYPFASAWRNLEFNLVYGISNGFGTEPWWFYLDGLRQYWHGFVIVIPLLALLGLRRGPALVLAAIAVLVAHTAIAHKEMRFIYPATLMLTVAAGLGLARIAAWLTAARRLDPARCAALFILFVVASSASLAASPLYRVLLRGWHDTVEADLFVARLPSLCGIGTWGANAGHTYLHRDVPIFWTVTQDAVARYRAGFNVLLLGDAVPPPPGYSVLACFGTVCVTERAGACAKLTPPPLPRPAALAHVAD